MLRPQVPQLRIEGSTFLHNRAVADGGGALAVDHGEILLTGCVFLGNRAHGLDATGGGAAFIDGGTIRATNSTFVGDFAGAPSFAGNELFLRQVTRWDIRASELAPFVQGVTIYSIGSASGGCEANPCEAGDACSVRARPGRLSAFSVP